MALPGDILDITLQIKDGSTDKYVVAVLRDDNGIELAASPVDLTHVGEGKYIDNSVAMPSGVKFVEATYIVYDDAAKTKETYKRGTDSFELNEALLSKLNEIIGRLEGTLGSLTSVVGTIERNEIVGVISDLRKIVGEVEEDEVTGRIIEDEVSGELVANEIKGKVNEC